MIVSDGKVYIASELGGATSAFKMAEITLIGWSANKRQFYEGHDSPHVWRYSCAQREPIYRINLPYIIGSLFSQASSFRYSVRQSGQTKLLTAQAVKSLPVTLAKESFEELFKFEVLEQQQALLTINLFWWEDKERFYQFTQHAFEQLKEQGIQASYNRYTC